MNPASVGGLMGPSGMSSAGMSPARAAGLAPFYAGQRLPQHGYPGPPQAQPLPRQGVKRAYSSEVYPGQQYLPGGQYAPGPGQSPAPSSYPGHRLPLSTSGPPGLHYKPTRSIPGYPSFLGPRTFPDAFPPTTASTPTLPEFTPGPPISYQSDIPSSLLTPEKSASCLPGQMAPAGHLDLAHNPGPPGLHTPNLGGPPGPQLHHPNPPPASRQPLGPVSSGPVGELAFNAATGVMGPHLSGAGEAPEPALDLLPELTNPDELLSYLGPPDLPANSNDDLLSLFENN
ncbi:zinc finger MIZ-type containing 2 [Rhinolophus ferrumequinum]|uniref:Zinc finger MIZ-type containing 2 n=1 Tax=Rhinolophus ferrumequinum TaxID=59479 RepID=A0A7J7TN33_RHIFE|nr:zinc finger MIZ-type containing 2 [Rhinolophus ferrumequinum]